MFDGFSCVFFFKQKTAYEMRISDWSSDVCSSDLLAGDVGGDVGFVLVVSGDDLDRHVQYLAAEVLGRHLGRFVGPFTAEVGIDARLEIGRASCRGRVLQLG